MMTGFSRVLASGMMLFLALTATTLVQRAGASTSVTSSTTDSTSTEAPATSTSSTDAPVTSTSSTDAPVTTDTGDDTDDETASVACAAEINACIADTTCNSCYYTESDAADDCKTVSLFSGGADSCEFNLDEACCLDDLSELECLDSDVYVAFYMCFLDNYGCILDEITCDGEDSTTEFDGASSNLGPVSTALAFSTAFTALLPFLWG